MFKTLTECYLLTFTHRRAQMFQAWRGSIHHISDSCQREGEKWLNTVFSKGHQAEVPGTCRCCTQNLNHSTLPANRVSLVEPNIQNERRCWDVWSWADVATVFKWFIWADGEQHLTHKCRDVKKTIFFSWLWHNWMTSAFLIRPTQLRFARLFSSLWNSYQ